MSEDILVTQELDVRGLNCPVPILRTKAAFAHLDSGDVLRVEASNVEYIHEIHNFSNQMGHHIIDEQRDGDLLIFLVKKG